MIIMIGGAPCTGKSTLMRSILEELNESVKIEPMKLFPCQKHGDILVIGYYPEGETFGGTDKISHGAIPFFRKFIEQEYLKWKHMLVEGDRFFRSKDIEWILNKYNDSKIYVLTVSREEEKKRHIDRGDTQKEVWLKGRRSQIGNIMTNIFTMNLIEQRTNDDEISAKLLKQEILKLLE